MLKYLWVIIIFLTMPVLHAKENKKDALEIQKKRTALLIEQKRLLDEVAVLQKSLQELKLLHQEKEKNLSENKQEVANSLPLLVRLGRINPLQLLVDPATSQNTLRGIILIRSLTEALKRQINQLQTELIEIKALSKEVESQEQASVKLLRVVEIQKLQLLSIESETMEEVKNRELKRLEGEEDINTLLDETRATLSIDKS